MNNNNSKFKTMSTEQSLDNKIEDFNFVRQHNPFGIK